MNNPSNSRPKTQGSMPPAQAAPSGSNHQRSQRSTSGQANTANMQQSSSTPQQFNAAFWVDPMTGTQYYGNNPYAPQNVAYDPNFYMAASQQTSNPQQMFNSQQMPNTQQYATTNFGGQSFQTPLNPADATLHNWAMATTHENSRLGSDMSNNGWGSNVQYSGQQYPGQQAFVPQASFQQAPAQQIQFQQSPTQQATVQQTFIQQSPEAEQKQEIHDDYTIYDMNGDASAQLLGELNGASRSPTLQEHQLLEVADNKDIDMSEDVIGSTADSVPSINDWSDVFAGQHGNDSADEIFRSFEAEMISAEAERTAHRQLEEEVDQVIEDLNDEEMQGIVSEDQTVVGHTPEDTDITSITEHDHDVDAKADDYVEDPIYEEEPVTTEQVDTPPTSPAQISEKIAKNNEPEEEVDKDDTSEEEVDEDERSEEEANEDDDVENVSEPEIIEDDVLDTTATSDQEAHDPGVKNPTFVKFQGYTLTMGPLKTIKTRAMNKEDKELHHKATKLIPHHLPPSRYWTAILHHSVAPNKAKVEKDFIWMKGSRFNTVETIYNKYKEVTTEDRHQILFCNEPAEFDNALEELDIFDDKLVVFRARVLPKQVIEID
ncbi:hypothetical protein D6D13_06190 [Aureobasidium pullulans]|uniref:Uncharacterized protein n=1 Tax=Aureobasidium pullulans TaxID=5580 RepID=A0A4S9CRM6_AURPU|nr:hypothetical protein D6D13_06190 [Aureobasidium pullulans]